MDRKDFIGIVLVVFLSLWGMLYLEADLASYFMEELFVILIFTIISIGLLYGIATEKDWAWSAMTAFFAFAAINTVIVYLATGNATPFLLTLFVNIAGFGVCGANAVNFEFIPSQMPSPEEDIPDLPPMPVTEDHIYHVDESDLIDHVEVELETYKEEPFIARNAPKVSNKKRVAGKKNLAKPGKKKSAKKKKR